MKGDIRVIKNSIPLSLLSEIAEERYGDLVKAVVDVEQGIMALGGEMHADEEVILMEQEGSLREHTWGINLLPAESGDEFIQFDSMVNLKPGFGNRTRNVDNEEIREKIVSIVQRLIKK